MSKEKDGAPVEMYPCLPDNLVEMSGESSELGPGVGFMTVRRAGLKTNQWE